MEILVVTNAASLRKAIEGIPELGENVLTSIRKSGKTEILRR